jgi:hypothetical protein
MLAQPLNRTLQLIEIMLLWPKRRACVAVPGRERLIHRSAGRPCARKFGGSFCARLDELVEPGECFQPLICGIDRRTTRSRIAQRADE